MTRAEAVDITDEHVRWCKRKHDPIPAHLAWRLWCEGPYPGGGWERVRSEFVCQMRSIEEQPQPMRRAA